MASSGDVQASGPAGCVAVVDKYPEAAKLIERGVDLLSRVLVSTTQQQVDGSIAELKTLEQAHSIVGAQYAEVRDNVKNVGAYLTSQADLAAQLAPHLAVLDDLEKVVAQLEEGAAGLDAQTKALEGAFGEIL